MPNIVEADIEVGFEYDYVRKIMGSITSVKRLYFCLLISEDVYILLGNVFHRLEYLMICTCEPEWLEILMCLLRDSPKLQSLKLDQCHSIEPSSVPESVLSSLETFEWVKYEGRQEEKEVAAFILRNGSCLKKVTISSKSTESNKKKLEMIKELSFLSRPSSPTCHLIF